MGGQADALLNGPDKALDVVLVGAGGWGRQLALALGRCSRLRLAGVHDANVETGAALAGEFGCAWLPDAETFLADPAIDGLIVATPNTTHLAWAELAFARGKALFVEKPIARTVAEAQAMRTLAQNADCVLMVGHNTRRHAGHRRLKGALDAGALGAVVMAEAHFSHAGGMGLTGAEWRASREECPAVGLMQLGVHHADTLQYLLGPVCEATALFAHVATPVDMDDATLALLRFASGPLAYLGSNYASPHRFHLALYGTRANAFCTNGGDVELHRAGEAPITLAVAPIDTLVEELTEFAACVRGKIAPETDALAGIRALAVVEAALQSAAERRTVALSALVMANGENGNKSPF